MSCLRQAQEEVAKLVSALGSDGFELVAKLNVQGAGIEEIGNKLGLSSKQYMDLKGGAIKEVFKRMDGAI
jgi:hypothetical protein